jgi:acyl transferase domain-containing protein/acyl carrier protein
MVDLEPPAYRFHELDMRSADGRCLPFMAGSTGTAFSNGASAVLLKRWDLARGDGDRILGEIAGSAINNDGNDKIGLSAPSVRGQTRVISEAIAVAGVPVRRIGMFEAHGTGTPLGDPIEVAAATSAFRASGEETGEDGFCRLHSLKANIGHLSHAAGVAGLILAIEALRHEEIPPNAPLREGGEGIDLDGSPFRLSPDVTPWPRGTEPRYASVSSLGIGGTNAHVVVGEGPVPRPIAPAPSGALLLSGSDPRTLAELTGRMRDHLASGSVAFADLCRTSQTGRHHGTHRLAVVADTAEAAVRGLDDHNAWRDGTVLDDPRVVGIVGGQGRGFPQRSRELYERHPVFRATVDDLSKIVQEVLGTDLRAQLFGAATADDEPLSLQPALFVVASATADLLATWGVRPGAYLGHSVGEFIGASLAGLLPADSAVRALCERARLMADAPPGVMWSVTADPESLSERLPRGAVVAVINTESRCVVAAPAGAADGMAETLAEITGRPIRRLPTRQAFHHPDLGDAAARFADHLAALPLRAPAVPVASNATGGLLSAPEATDPAYWARQMTAPARFWDCVTTVTALGPASYLELTEGQTFVSIVARAGVPARQCHPLFADDDPDGVRRALGGLWAAGTDVDWDAVADDSPFGRTAYPGQAMDLREYLHPVIRGGTTVTATDPEPASAGAGPVPAPVPVPDPGPGSGPGVEQDDGMDELRALVGGIWAEVLGDVPGDGRTDFFASGGDSISAGQLVTRLQAAFGIELAVRRLFESSTLDGLVAAVDEELLARVLAETEPGTGATATPEEQA